MKSETVTFRIKVSYLYLFVALLVGCGIGATVTRIFFPSVQAMCSILEEGIVQQQAAVVPVPTPTPTPTPSPTIQQPSPTQIAKALRPYRGPADAPVTIIEFTDYQCPFCRQHFEETLPQILKEYEDKVRYEVRNFPLSRIHPFAQKAAEAAECAYDQDKFWEYHDVLFQNQKALGETSLKQYARDVRLDPEAFDLCLDSGVKKEQVLQDVQEGVQYGVSGTPNFFLNGNKISVAASFSTFKGLIEEALAK